MEEEEESFSWKEFECQIIRDALHICIGMNESLMSWTLNSSFKFIRSLYPTCHLMSFGIYGCGRGSGVLLLEGTPCQKNKLDAPFVQ